MPDTLFKDSQSDQLILFPTCDPKFRLSRCFENDKIDNKPELIILNWLVSLPDSVDPAFAAKSVLLKLNTMSDEFSEDQQSLLNLLNEISIHPRKKLLTRVSSSKRNQRGKIGLRRSRQIH